MNKKLLSVFFAVLLCVVVSVPAFADTAEDYTPHLIDNADLLTGEEESNLLAKLDEISDRLSVDVAVVTEDSIGDKTPREYADDFYDYNSYKYNPDGVLLLISMEERDWYITTTGSAITAITDARRGNMEDAFLSDLSGGYYYDAFSTYADMCDNNNNCAGSIVGYSTGGTFEKCAAENNQIRTMAYGGGFVGEVDDDPDYGSGNSTFTNCYTANCSVSSKTDDVQGVSLVGGFVGEMTDSALTVNNCYVYRAMLSTEGTAVPGIKATGVFAGHLWGGSSIVDTNCFFGACGITENAGTASEKTEEEFRNGTVAGLLGEAFAQVGDYPKFNGPADYSSVDAAIAKANALEKDNYKDFSAVETAVNAVVRGKMLSEQADVDAMAQAIENAITVLQYKDADYTKVDEAIAKANALNKDAYTNFTAVEAAINAVVRDKNITEQDKVDAMAKAIEDAMAALVEKPTEAPTATPTATPTAAPSTSPTEAPTATPTATPTAAPSASPTAAPTATPTVKPTATPSASPTAVPTATPTVKPTATPTPAPKADPNNPKTGSSNLPVVFGSAALVLSGGALAAVLIYKKKRHEK